VTASDPGTERSAGEVSNPGADLAELVALGAFLTMVAFVAKAAGA